MIETPLGTLFYLGAKKEPVTVTVTPQNTTQLVEYTLDGHTDPFPSNGVLNFNLKDDGTPTTLQLVFDFDSPSGGSYVVSVRTVTNPEYGGESFREWLQAGSSKLFKDYVFDTQ